MVVAILLNIDLDPIVIPSTVARSRPTGQLQSICFSVYRSYID